MIRVFLVDDHEVVRRGIADLLGREDDIEIVGEAANVAQALTRVRAVRPDVAVLDLRLPDGDGVGLCREIRSQLPETRCIILTAYDDDEAAVAAVLAGASGYVGKSVRGSTLVEDVRAVAGGRSLIDARVSQHVADRAGSAHATDPRFGSLSLRERQVLTLIAEGLTNRQIGERLSLAEKTVKNYVTSLLAKLGFERRTQAAAFGAIQGESRDRAHRRST
ncbi:response regulator [Ruania halotolerans]|uniref:response regulator n=1 Tax=Ruania halotolerans TaxID=2897773 RepID=UPI001E437790|nr:response regulator transcription factor [Ruania halotolerans]UFU08191.1 response regulator transcription factor [Ruania halotolerans]